MVFPYKHIRVYIQHLYVISIEDRRRFSNLTIISTDTLRHVPSMHINTIFTSYAYPIHIPISTYLSYTLTQKVILNHAHILVSITVAPAEQLVDTDVHAFTAVFMGKLKRRNEYGGIRGHGIECAHTTRCYHAIMAS